MRGLEAIIPLLVALALTTSRFAGMVLTSPFPGPSVPATPKVALVCVLGWFATATIDTSHLPTQLRPALLGGVLLEIGCGVLVGFTLRLVMSAAEILGAVAANTIGLGTLNLFNPTTGAHDTPLHHLTTITAMLLALAAGVHRTAVGFVLRSFEVLPIGASASLSAATPPLVSLFARSIEVGLRLGLPLVGVGLVVQLALGIVARAAPALQVFNVGFGITIVAGMAALLDSLEGMTTVLSAHLRQAPEWIELVLRAAAGGV
jgi:flagellar biosynthetic protein FliR